MLALSQTKIFLHHHKSLHGWLNYRPDTYLDFLLGLLNPKRGELILDNGCGNGRFSVVMGQKGSNVIALDINKSLLKKAANRAQEERMNHQVELVLADMQNLPFKVDVFDKILCVHNLWYVPNYKGAVREMLRTLRKSGTILVDHLNLLNPHVFLAWVPYIGAKILRQSSTPVFFRIPYEILHPFSHLQTKVFSLIIKQRSTLYARRELSPLSPRLIIKSFKQQSTHPLDSKRNAQILKLIFVYTRRFKARHLKRTSSVQVELVVKDE